MNGALIRAVGRRCFLRRALATSARLAQSESDMVWHPPVNLVDNIKLTYASNSRVGRVYVDIRKYEAKDGDGKDLPRPLPTKKGIFLSVDDWDKLKTNFWRIDAAVAEMKAEKGDITIDDLTFSFALGFTGVPCVHIDKKPFIQDYETATTLPSKKAIALSASEWQAVKKTFGEIDKRLAKLEESLEASVDETSV